MREFFLENRIPAAILYGRRHFGITTFFGGGGKVGDKIVFWGTSVERTCFFPVNVFKVRVDYDVVSLIKFF